MVVELNGVRIWAVAVDGGTLAPPRKLVCGTLARPCVEVEPAVNRPKLADRLAVPGRPDVSVAWTGWFELTDR